VTESVSTRCVAGLIVCLLLGGCAGGSRIPEDSFYRLEQAAPTARLAAPVLDGILMVQGGAAAPIYRDRALLYSEPGEPARLQRYHYQSWIDSPPQLLQRSLADYLRASGVAPAVVTPEDAIDARYRLRVDVERFEQVRGDSGSRVVVGLNMTLTERTSGKLLVQEQLRTDSAVQGDDFTAMAAAYERALDELYTRILSRCAAQ